MWAGAAPGAGAGAAVTWAERSWGAVPVRRDEDEWARYQQRQHADREQRLLQLYAEQRAQQERTARRQRQRHRHQGSAGSSSSSSTSQSSLPLPCGKVRQLFEGRRHQRVGRDRGQPLAPIAPLGDRPPRPTRSSSNVNLSHSYHYGQRRGHSLDRALPLRRQQVPQPAEWADRRRDLDYNSDSSDSDRGSPLYSRSFALYEDVRIVNRLPNVGGSLQSQEPARGEMAPPARLSAAAAPARRAPAPANENAPPAPAAAPAPAASKTAAPPSKLPARKPTGLPTPITAANRASPLRPSSGQRSAPSGAPLKSAGRTSQVASPAAKSNGAPKPQPVGSKILSPPPKTAASKAGMSSQPKPMVRTQPRQDDGLVACALCSRRFAPDRVAKHQEICAKSGQKKRKTFDPVVARVKGTEAEKYLRRAKAAPQPKAMKNNNWRRKHEDFIQTIRAAKQVQAHLAKGGKVSDLPPPPPSDYSDYVPCPHCGRKFNQTAAERHIPKCATMLHNKPKPGAAPKAGGSKGALSTRR